MEKGHLDKYLKVLVFIICHNQRILKPYAKSCKTIGKGLKVNWKVTIFYCILVFTQYIQELLFYHATDEVKEL